MSAREILNQVAQRIADLGLTRRDAARMIGVTEDSLARHLAGEYVRSDSLAKYRLWLNGGRRTHAAQLELETSTVQRDENATLRALRLADPSPPERPAKIVDLFCGCGGLSLGFDLYGGGLYFDTVLAIDIEAAMVDTLNRNRHRAGFAPVARRVDLADFVNESEVRAFYLDHLATLEADAELQGLLDEIQPVGLSAFLRSIHRLDMEFLERMAEYRGTSEFLQAYGALDTKVLGQTSVLGFHDTLKLPMPSTRVPTLEPLIWSGQHAGSDGTEDSLPKDVRTHWLHLEATVRAILQRRWEAEVARLRERTESNGRGQLASSGRRVAAFLKFLEATPSVRALWLDWRSRRDSLRFLYFENEQVASALSKAYTGDRRVAVILGGPPCQGFSRIGRGKIRSLREGRVHVHYDQEAGDIRNRLFEKYVLFVSALAPAVFLFENVRHFQTRVGTAEGSFLATDVLAEAVRDLSADGLDYRIASRTIMASDHGVPQSRERFFMVGVRADTDCGLANAASWVLSLPMSEEVPLRAALEDLPEPAGLDHAGNGSVLAYSFEEAPLPPADGGDAEARYKAWIRQPHPMRPKGTMLQVDAHVARDHRPDDRAWFRLMGPGTRWMDYRCDGSPTLARMRAALAGALELAERADPREPTGLAAELRGLIAMLDGSLSLRLLLENLELPPGEMEHHLARPTYLEKREGNHGDWLARLDPTRPSRTIVTHMGKDTYAYIHPWRDGTLSVREAARIQSFPDWFSFGNLGLVDGFRVVGNAVPPLLSAQFADRVSQLLSAASARAIRPELRAALG